MASSKNEITNFLRSDHFTTPPGNSKKSILEMGVTRMIDDTTVAGTSGNWLIWQGNQLQPSALSATALTAQGYELDHVFERQFISALFIAEVGDTEPPMSVLKEVIGIANLSSNLVFIPRDFHHEKSAYFNAHVQANPFTEDLGLYLEACQVHFKAQIDQYNLHGSDQAVTNLVNAIKATPWYVGDWESYAGENWYD